jgi:hypothetical protein
MDTQQQSYQDISSVLLSREWASPASVAAALLERRLPTSEGA